ncbi:hypothetical protein CR513_44437, partial [Mucuna pruriens]
MDGHTKITHVLTEVNDDAYILDTLQTYKVFCKSSPTSKGDCENHKASTLIQGKISSGIK